tara:strand:+ start:753 stop:1280 length:528 start_codon:yes stop_codon:yes gene_type:complete
MKKDTIYVLIGFLLVILVIINQNDNGLNINILKDLSDSSESQDDEPRGDDDLIGEPKRHYDSKYITRKQMKINVPTRGDAPSYQQVGILTDVGDPENIKPLYGRQTYRGSGKWNYFTSLDSHLATKIPIYIDDKDCVDESGCREIYKNDALDIGRGGNQYTADIYQTHAPRYIPY